MTYQFVLRIMLMLRIWHGDAGESQEHRIERLEGTAKAIAHYAHTYEELAFMLTQAEAESHLASYVLEGRCLDGPKEARCDPDKKTGIPRASGPWQVWLKYCKGALSFPEGSNERIDATASCIAGKMRFGLKMCGSWAGAFASLKGPYCGWSEGQVREQRMRQILVKIQGGFK